MLASQPVFHRSRTNDAHRATASNRPRIKAKSTDVGKPCWVMINSDYIWLYGVTVILDYDYLCVYIDSYIKYTSISIFTCIFDFIFILYLYILEIIWDHNSLLHSSPFWIKQGPSLAAPGCFSQNFRGGGHLLRGCWEDGTHGRLVGLFQDFKGARLERHLGRFCGMLMDFDLGMLLWTLDRSPAISWMVCRRCHSATVFSMIWMQRCEWHRMAAISSKLNYQSWCKDACINTLFIWYWESYLENKNTYRNLISDHVFDALHPVPH